MPRRWQRRRRQRRRRASGAGGKQTRETRAGRGRLGERYRDARLGDERRSGASFAARSDWTRSGGRRTRASEGSDDVVEGWETRGTRGGSDGAHGDVGVAGEERDGGRVRVRFAGARGWVRFAARDAVAAREDAMKTDERDARERHVAKRRLGSHFVANWSHVPTDRDGPFAKTSAPSVRWIYSRRTQHSTPSARREAHPRQRWRPQRRCSIRSCSR